MIHNLSHATFMEYVGLHVKSDFHQTYLLLDLTYEQQNHF
jgi:hypothetical protein